MNKHWLLLEFQHHLAKVSSLNLWYLCRGYLGICDDGHVKTVKVRRDAKFLVQQESHVPTPPSVAPLTLLLFGNICFFGCKNSTPRICFSYPPQSHSNLGNTVSTC